MIKTIKLKEYAANEIAKGATVDVLFGDQIPLIGPRGRIANVLGVELFAITQYDNLTVAASQDVRFFQRKAFRNIRLTDNLGHVYIDNLYGDEVFDHMYMQNGAPVYSNAPPSLAAQQTNATVNTSLWIPFSPGRIDAQEDGGICLPLLDNRINSSAKLSFQIGTGTTLDTNGNTNVTWDGLTALTAYAYVRYEDPIVDVNWFLRNLRDDTRTQLVFPDPGATMRYIVARDSIDQTGGADMSSTYYSNWNVEVMGAAWTKGGETSAERVEQMRMALACDPFWDLFTRSGFDTWNIAAQAVQGVVPIVYPGPRPHRSDYVSGEIMARFTRATKTATSFYLNGFFDYPEAKTAFIAERCGLDIAKIRRNISVLSPRGVNSATERKIPAKIKAE